MYSPARAAQRIFDSRAAGERFEPASAWYGPGFDLKTAYAVQDAYLERIKARRGTAVAGYKIGLTSHRMQALCGVAQPIAGVVLADGLLQSPGQLRAADYLRLGIECEIAVRMGADLAPSEQPLDADAIDRSIDQIAAAVEIVDDAHADYASLDGGSIVADNSWNAGLLLGPVSTYDGRGLTGRSGVLYRNGEALDRGSSDDVLGDPLAVVLWLAEHLARRGARLRRGDWITTGSIVTTKFVSPGEAYEFRVDGLEPVSLKVG